MSFDWSSILGTAANAASGGILGLAGSAISGVTSYFQAKNQFKHDESMADKAFQLATLQKEAAKDLTEAQFKTMQEQQAGQAFTASQQGAASVNMPGWALGSLTIYRELLTTMLVAFAITVYLKSSGEAQEAAGQQIIFLGSTAVMWFFGIRASEAMIAAKLKPSNG